MSAAVNIRRPSPEDGAGVWALIRDAGGLDLNSAYCYLLLCDYFRDTCRLAEQDSRIVGFVSAFRAPGKKDTLFVWQLAVAAKARGQGIAGRLLDELADGLPVERPWQIETTISPSNAASQAVFAGFAARRGASMSRSRGYVPDLFPLHADHEEELLFRVGPINKIR